MKQQRLGDGGFTLVELLITTVLLATVTVSILGLFITLVRSSIVAKHQSVALTLATDQMEYLKSLPYDSLGVVGGSFSVTNPLPAKITKELNGVTYTLTTSISYIDDAYDGCASGITSIPLALRPTYCRNYPPPSNVTMPDSNPADYKIVDVTVTGPANDHLAELNTQISARVAESASTKGALFVTVIDSSGNPVSGATVNLSNPNLTPAVNLSDTTDQNGIAIFYNLAQDSSGNHYQITASNSGYSTLATIPPTGSLQATYSNQNIIAQQSSFVTLTIKQQGANSLLLEATDTIGTPLNGAKIYIKGGYKQYTATTDTTYYYDNFAGGRAVTDPSTGQINVNNLVPGSYIFCGDSGATSCVNSAGMPIYLVAAVPYSGTTVFNPVTVPSYDPAHPPATTYAYNSANYLQKVRLLFSTLSTFPRVNSLSPYEVNLSGGAAAFNFTVTGTNLPCSNIATSCGTTVAFIQGAQTYPASCTGTSGTQLGCTVNMSGATAGNTQLSLSAGGNTLTIPASLNLGGLIVSP